MPALPFPNHQQMAYSQIQTNLLTYNTMLIQLYVPLQQPGPNYNFITQTKTTSQEVSYLLFAKELLDYMIPNTAKLSHLKTYIGSSDPDSYIYTNKWTMTSLKVDKHFLVYILRDNPRRQCRHMVPNTVTEKYIQLWAVKIPLS